MTNVQEFFAWGLAVFLILVFPVTEVARGMATNPDNLKYSRKAAIISVIGLLMALWLFMYA